jgi:ATP-dependent RNA helicase DHX37/DHR1
MHTPREKYNAKARGSTAGSSRKKGKRRAKGVTLEQVDPNAVVHLPKPVELKDQERRERLRQEVGSCFF